MSDQGQSTEQLSLLVNVVEEYAIFLLDREGRVQTWNAGARRLKGYSADEIIGRHFSCFYTEEDRLLGVPDQMLERAAREGQVRDSGQRVRKDGTRFSAYVVIKALRNGAGELVGFGKVTRNRTAQEEQAHELARERGAREASARSEEWLRTTLRSIGDAVIATDERACVRFMNGVSEELTGWTEAEARGRPLSEVFHIVNEYTRAIVESPVDRVLREGVVVGLANHTILVARDGVERPIDDSGAPIRDLRGQLVGVVLVFRDITERRRAEAELEAAHAEALASLEQATSAVRESERANDRLSFLAEASTLLGSSLDYPTTLRNVARMAVPRLADWCSVDIVENGEPRNLAVEHADPAKLALVEELRRRWPPDPKQERGVHQVVRSGRTEVHPSIPDEMLVAAARDEEHLRLLHQLGLRSAVVVPIASGDRRFGALTLVNAESARRFGSSEVSLAEELGRRAGLAIENARLFREAELANRTKDEFLATLSHELRTPLNAILGWALLLRRGALASADSARAIETIERNARLQAELIDDVLEVSRIVAGKLQIELRPVDLVEVVAGVVNGVRPQAHERGIALSCAASAPSIPMLGDAARLQQVFSNLLANALKFTPSGGRIDVAIEVGVDRAVVRVRDTGAGIAPSFLPHLFERFTQADSSTRRAHGGLGIGLSIVRHLAERHGGRVRAESPGEGHGSTFVVELPLREDVALDGSAEDDATESLEGVRILVVDDEPDTRDLLASALGGRGAQVRTAPSAGDALRLLDDWRPDLLVSDIAMPGTDGYELLRRVRARTDDRAGIPAIALTAYAGNEHRDRAFAAGYQRHVPKPVDPWSLGTLASHLVRRR